ncbi:MarR family winged helix-turn-helix transcriptional regulator [Nocardioides lijunqiniae]|uniref:MarR family winged helix-turn-helix transcriptional regulator n=1 Tax=Nocardioides lijunqiniae TaxID=2760832 RepID=UPI0018778F61|nr:MarR family transcriptional regulator [Nocardioides lijunqiniae]
MSDFDVNPPTMEAVQDLVVAALEVRRAVARRSGLSDLELAALEHVVTEPSSPGELARLLKVTTGASTGVVDRLEQRGHVQRRAHESDRRRTVVHVTPSGRTEIVDHLRPMLVALTELDEGLSDTEREVVERYLRGVIAAFGQVSDGD